MKHLLVIGAFGLSACHSHRGEWDASVYPDAKNRTLAVTLNGFDTLDQCQEAASDMLQTFKNPEQGDFDCSRNCKWNPSLGVNVCEEIE